MKDDKAVDGHAAPRTRDRRGNESATRDDILLAAAQLIASQGYGACTMRAISEAVNIKAGSLYYHFEGKQEIVVEIMNKGVEMLLDAVSDVLAGLPADAPFRDRLRAAVKAHIRSKVSRDTPFMQVYEHLTPAIKREGAEMRRKYTRLWFDLLDEGVRAGAIRPELDRGHFIPYLLSGLNRAPEWFNPDHITLDAATDLVMDVMLNGLFTAAGKDG